MTIDRDRLRIIGKMMGVYREEKRANKQNCFSQKWFCKDICSKNTLRNIERGGFTRSIEVYEDLFAKLDLRVGEFPRIDHGIDALVDTLYTAIEYFQVDAITRILHKLIRLLDRVANYVYYSEIRSLAKALQAHYEKDSFIGMELWNRYKAMMYILPYRYKDLFRLLLYTKIKAESITDKKQFATRVMEITLEDSRANFMKIAQLDYAYIMGNYLKMEELIANLVTVFEREHNVVRLFDTYECAIVLMSRIEFDKSVQYSKEAKKMMAHTQLPPCKVNELYSNIARAYHIHGEYQEALDHYMRMIDSDYACYIDSYIFMADCQNHVHVPIAIPRVAEEAVQQYPKNVRLMYTYFTLGLDLPSSVKENYIITKIAPILTDDAYIQVFRYELLRLVSITMHYRRLHTFECNVSEALASTT